MRGLSERCLFRRYKSRDGKPRGRIDGEWIPEHLGRETGRSGRRRRGFGTAVSLVEEGPLGLDRVWDSTCWFRRKYVRIEAWLGTGQGGV